MSAVALEMPLNIDPDTVALVFDLEDAWTEVSGFLRVYDECGNWETALNYVQSGGYLVVAMNGDRFPFETAEALQEAIDREYALRADCFGTEVPTLTAA